jgi:hypothetical protein
MANAQNILDAAELIESFVNGTCGPYDWDDFLNGSKKDTRLQEIREECERVEIDHPARTEHEWCNDGGAQALLAIAARLRREATCCESAGIADPEGPKSKPNKSW